MTISEIQNHGIREEQIVANELVRFSDESHQAGMWYQMTVIKQQLLRIREAHEYLSLPPRQRKTLDSPTGFCFTIVDIPAKTGRGEDAGYSVTLSTGFF